MQKSILLASHVVLNEPYIIWTSFLTLIPWGHGQLVDGDRGVSYTHRNLPLDGEEAAPASGSVANRMHTLSNGNKTTTIIEPTMSNGALSTKGLSINGTVTPTNNRA
jgi:hypothetical protein